MPVCFVTVGTFSFDLLVRAVLSEPVLDALQARGYTLLVIQHGDSEVNHSIARTALDIESWARKPSLDEDFRRADLVIGHAGAGTILDVLRLHKPLIVVPNESLLHNHQLELATALAASNHLRTSTIADLAHSVTVFDPAALAKFEPFDGSKFRALVDEEMGFES